MSFTADPRILLRYQLPQSIIEAHDAIVSHYRSEAIAKAIAKGSRLSFTNSFAIVAAVCAVEAYKHSADRRDELHRHRLSQRTSQRRSERPLTREPRRPNEWDGSPRIPAFSADQLSLTHADELLSLMWLGFFASFTTQQAFDPAALKLIEEILPKIYRKPRSRLQIRDALRKAMSRRLHRRPHEDVRRFYGIEGDTPASMRQLAGKVFRYWKDGLRREQVRSDRVKSSTISSS